MNGYSRIVAGLAAVAIVVAVGVFALRPGPGIGGPGPTPTAFASASPAATAPQPTVSDAACRLLQPGEVDATSPGYPGLGAIPGAGGTGAVTTCVYSSGGGDIQARLTLTKPGGVAAFQIAKGEAGAQTIADLGVPAVFNPNTLTLSILKGDAMVAIVPSFLATTTEQRIAMASAMARLIITRL